MINKEGIVHRLVALTIAFVVVAGVLQSVLPIRPFWVDEWRVIYNLKFRSAAALWGPMDFMQQFPRVYLQLMKVITAPFGYSYASLRIPSLIISCCTIGLCWQLTKKRFGPGRYSALLFTVFILSSYTFTEYFVQIKQYSMDVCLSVAVLWQLAALMYPSPVRRQQQYVLLCTSFLVLPFFSYTYPIALAPLYGVAALQWYGAGKMNRRQLLPLGIGIISTVAFYFLDARQLIGDKGMSHYWMRNMYEGSWQRDAARVYALFAQAGPGAFFGNLIGVLGIIGFLRGLFLLGKVRKQPPATFLQVLRIYSTLLILLALALFFVRRLPLGEPRLNAFTMPALALLIMDLLNSFMQRRRMAAQIIIAVLYLGLPGNIYTTIITFFTEDKYAVKMEIYKATQHAIELARRERCPILITPGIAYPHEGTPNYPLLTPLPGDWILKTFPAYKVSDTIAVYPIAAVDKAQAMLNNLPPGIRKAVAGDGIHYSLIRRR